MTTPFIQVCIGDCLQPGSSLSALLAIRYEHRRDRELMPVFSDLAQSIPCNLHPTFNCGLDDDWIVCSPAHDAQLIDKVAQCCGPCRMRWMPRCSLHRFTIALLGYFRLPSGICPGAPFPAPAREFILLLS